VTPSPVTSWINDRFYTTGSSFSDTSGPGLFPFTVFGPIPLPNSADVLPVFYMSAALCRFLVRTADWQIGRLGACIRVDVNWGIILRVPTCFVARYLSARIVGFLISTRYHFTRFPPLHARSFLFPRFPCLPVIPPICLAIPTTRYDLIFTSALRCHSSTSDLNCRPRSLVSLEYQMLYGSGPHEQRRPPASFIGPVSTLSYAVFVLLVDSSGQPSL